jgi:hypothetical protein
MTNQKTIESYTNVNKATGEMSLPMRYQRTILKWGAYCLKHNENLSTWSDDMEVFDALSHAYKSQLQQLASDIEYRLEYDLERQTGREIIEARKSEDAA